MIKKIIAYQKLISSVQSVSRGRGIKMFVFILLFIIANTINAILGFQSSFGTYFFIVALFMGAYQLTNVRKSLFRNMPVSDRFAVVNCMFVMPAWLFTSTFLILIILGLLSYSISSTGSIGEIGAAIVETIIYQMFGLNGSINLCGCLFAILFAAIIWFWFCMAVFTRNKKAKVVVYVLLLGLYIIMEVLMLKKAHAIGYFGGIRLSDIVELFPKYPLMIAVIILAIGSGIICYRYCVKVLRYDTKGQRTSHIDEAKEINVYNCYVKKNIRGGSEDTKKNTIVLLAILVLVTCAVLMFRELGLVEGSEEEKEFEYTTSSIDQYEEWEEMGKEDLAFISNSTIVFPEKIEGRNVVEYKASKYGTKNDGDWLTCTAYRFLVQKLSKEDFEVEKNRIASISCEVTGDEFGAEKVNHILHDTEHFSDDAYIAKYDYDSYSFEYAIVDEENLEITYLYCNGAEPRWIFKEYDIFPSLMDKVISIEDANTDYKGFDIESFYNTEYGIYVDAYSIDDEE